MGLKIQPNMDSIYAGFDLYCSWARRASPFPIRYVYGALIIFQHPNIQPESVYCFWGWLDLFHTFGFTV